MRVENKYDVRAGHPESTFVFEVPGDPKSGLTRLIKKWVDPDGAEEVLLDMVFDPPRHLVPVKDWADEPTPGIIITTGSVGGCETHEY